jgi:GTP-binding protein EngB required for normal cell division
MEATDRVVEYQSIEQVLDALLAISVKADNRGAYARLLGLREKLDAGQLHMAVLGQMKRGKSSLINALLKADVLPTGVLPVTAIITEIRYGEIPDATIVYAVGGLREQVALSSLADYISETRNPGNKKQVASVEVTYPSPFLKDGIVLIDTPGIGSTHAHNTETTERYLEQIDAGILVLSVDPPITEVESRFINDIRCEIPKLFFILNKTDIALPDELSEIVHFLEDELERLQVLSPEIFPLSARQDRKHSPHGAGDSALSGLCVFERRLQTFLSEEKRQVLIRSVSGDTLEVARTLRFAASVGARAATMNEDELENKRLVLYRLLEQTDVEMRELQVLLRQKSADILADVELDLTAQSEGNVSEVQKDLKLFQVQHPKVTGRAFGSLLEEFLMKEVEAVFRRWKVREDEKIQAQLSALSSRFVAQANGILVQLERAAGVLFDVPVEHLKINCSLRAESHLHYKVERVFYSLDSFLLLLPGFLLRPVVFRRMHNNVPLLLDMNAGRVRYDYLERLQASMNRFEEDLRRAVVMVTDSLSASVRTPSSNPEQRTAVVGPLDIAITNCRRLCCEQ